MLVAGAWNSCAVGAGRLGRLDPLGELLIRVEFVSEQDALWGDLESSDFGFVAVFGVGECARVSRDLPSIRAGAEGVVRGVSTNASGITYAIRFAATMRIVSERDLGANDENVGMSPFSGSGGDWLTGEQRRCADDLFQRARLGWGVMRAYLYDADGNDQECQLDAVDVDALGEKQFLWVDVDGDDDEVHAAGRVLAIDGETTAALLDGSREPSLFVHQEYFHVSVTVVQGDADQYGVVALDCVAGRNWVLTSHQEPVEFLEDFDDRFRGESNIGQFGSAGFVSALLTEQLLTYGRQLEPTVEQIDHLEQLVLRDRVDEGKLLRQLVAITQRIARLRRWLAPHREIFERLAQPNLSELLPDPSAEGLFPGLVDRLDRTLDDMDTTRQMAAGSIDLYTTLVAHGTNKVIKLLTVVSVALLPPTLLAGFLGMNSLPSSLKTTAAFWASVAVMLLLIATTLTLARRRGWI